MRIWAYLLPRPSMHHSRSPDAHLRHSRAGTVCFDLRPESGKVIDEQMLAEMIMYVACSKDNAPTVIYQPRADERGGVPTFRPGKPECQTIYTSSRILS